MRHLSVRCLVFAWLLAPAFVSLPRGATVTAQAPAAPPTLRLPPEVRPTRQALELTIDPAREKFSGVATVDISIGTDVPTIWMNAMALEIRDATYEAGQQNRSLRTVPAGAGVVGFASENGPFPRGEARLRIAYDGVISRRDIEGIFAQQEGNEWYVFTQFEPLGARRAFPSFDEPSFKIPWQVTLRIPQALSGFSNTPELRASPDADGMKTLAFAETKPMPSYLVSIAVGPFDVVSAGKAGRNGTPLRLLVPKGRSRETAWAAETTPKVISLLEEYFSLPFPYEKLDQVSVPMFFGAMENAGLVTYGQTLMLLKPGEETISARRGFATIAAHELAHHWFGNLVTTAWWDDLWLNEAFASWMENRIGQQLGPDWGVEVERVRMRSYALQEDSLVNARRIRQPIESPDDIANAFDSITYLKGEAVLGMFEGWLGEEVFRSGVQQYLKENAWKNATVAEFSRALAAAAKRDVTTPLASFLDQTGAPLVSVDLKCDAGRPRVALAQRKYRPLGSTETTSALWKVPVCVRYSSQGSQARQCTLLEQAAAEIPLDAAKTCPDWLLGNDGYGGYYRVRHSDDLLTRLLKGNELKVQERVGLLLDLPGLALSGDLPAARALEVAAAFANDPNRHIVQATTGIFRELRHLVDEGQRPAYEAFVRSVYATRAQGLGWMARSGESDDDRLLRLELLRIGGGTGDPVLGSGALKLAQGWLKDPRSVSPDVVDVMLAVAGRSATRSYFDQLREAVTREQDRERRQKLFGGLAAVRTPELLPDVLAITLDSRIDLRESMTLLFGLSSSPASRDAAFSFVTANYDKLAGRLPQGSVFDVTSSLPFVGQGFCDAGRRQEVEAFFAPRVAQAAGGRRNLAQALESIELCMAQRKQQAPSVAEFLQSRQR